MNYDTLGNKKEHIYFIGIGGVSMSGLAKILLSKGYKVSGSDLNKSSFTLELENMGVHINYNQVKENITEDIDKVIYTSAIHKDNEEYQKAKELGISMINRAKLLGEVMNEYKHSIAVSGTHGKTTTTAMISKLLLDAKVEPTISIGGILPIINGNLYIGSGDIFLTEACEYTNSFWDLNPNISIILNVEADHLDFFKDLDDIRHSFKVFIDNMPKESVLVINNEINKYEELIKDYKGQVITIGQKGADISYDNIQIDDDGFVYFELYDKKQKLTDIHLKLTGKHNVYNALCAIAVAKYLNVDILSIKDSLADFGGVKRRQELKGYLKGQIKIMDDYAHHPQEIEASLRAFRNYKLNRLVCVFQPHTYTRTKALLEEFAKALSLADVIVLAKIYPARETDTLGVSSADIKNILLDMGKQVEYIDNFDDIENYLLEELMPNDFCVTMGAGDIVKVGEKLLGE